MWHPIDRLCGFVIDAGVSATLLWSVAALSMLVCRQPARRLRLARVAIVASLAIPFVIAVGLGPRVDLVASVAGPSHASRKPPPRRLEFEATSESGPPRVVARPDTAPGSPMTAGPWPARVAALVYLVGLACGLAWLLLGVVALAWVRGYTASPSHESLSFYRSLSFKPLRDRPKLRLSPKVSRPVLVGSWNPIILVPPLLDRPEARDRLRLSLLHELAHAEAMDPLFGLLGNLAQALWFFIPPVWWIVAQVRLDQEFLADRQASVKFGPVGAYASSLLDLASTRVGGGEPSASSRASSGVPTPAGGFDVPGSSLFQRVLMLVRCPYPIEPAPPPSWTYTLPLVAVALTVAASSFSVRFRQVPVAVAPAHSEFQVSVWDTNPGGFGRPSVHELPLVLPGRFDLAFEIRGDLATLAATRVVGVRLYDPEHRPDATGGRANDPVVWHSVRLSRGADGISLAIDRRPIPLADTSQTLTPWLSVETPPGQTGKVRNLLLKW